MNKCGRKIVNLPPRESDIVDRRGKCVENHCEH